MQSATFRDTPNATIIADVSGTQRGLILLIRGYRSILILSIVDKIQKELASKTTNGGDKSTTTPIAASRSCSSLCFETDHDAIEAVEMVVARHDGVA